MEPKVERGGRERGSERDKGREVYCIRRKKDEGQEDFGKEREKD